MAFDLTRIMEQAAMLTDDRSVAAVATWQASGVLDGNDLSHIQRSLRLRRAALLAQLTNRQRFAKVAEKPRAPHWSPKLVIGKPE